MLRAAQADFRSNGRDGSKIQEFWTGNPAGLYGILPKGSSDMITLIELTMASADVQHNDSAPRRPGPPSPS